VVPASAFRAQQEQIRELQRLLGKKTLEAENLNICLDFAATRSGRTLEEMPHVARISDHISDARACDTVAAAGGIVVLLGVTVS
jgi:hypothetical protein